MNRFDFTQRQLKFKNLMKFLFADSKYEIFILDNPKHEYCTLLTELNSVSVLIFHLFINKKNKLSLVFSLIILICKSHYSTVIVSVCQDVSLTNLSYFVGTTGGPDVRIFKIEKSLKREQLNGQICSLIIGSSDFYSILYEGMYFFRHMSNDLSQNILELLIYDEILQQKHSFCTQNTLDVRINLRILCAFFMER